MGGNPRWIALAPQQDDSDAPAKILHDHFRLAPLLLIVAPEGLRSLLNRRHAHTNRLSKGRNHEGLRSRNPATPLECTRWLRR